MKFTKSIYNPNDERIRQNTECFTKIVVKYVYLMNKGLFLEKKREFREDAGFLKIDSLFL